MLFCVLMFASSYPKSKIMRKFAAKLGAIAIFRHCLVYLGVAKELLPLKSLILAIKKF